MSVMVRQDPALMQVNPPLVPGQPDYHDLTDQISTIVEAKVFETPMKYWITLGITSTIVVLLLSMLTYLAVTGIGVWGNNRPIGWAWDITNFVFWIGIGHAGTLISAILFLFRQKWRTSINRSAEAMTLFAVMCAAIFPLFHTGRPWRAYWLFPVPNTDLNMWQNFRSPLIWDVFAVNTYLMVSILFWYTGLVPDVATLRDRAKSKIRGWIYGALALGWRGSARHWRHYEAAYLILAGISTPLVLSVHSVVSYRLRHVGHPRLAHHHLPALLRRRRHLLRLRLRDDAAADRALAAESPESDHHEAPGEHEQDHPGDRIDRRLRLRDGVLHRLVQRQRV